MQTVTVDVINDKAMRLLQDLETLDLIKLHGVEDNAPKWEYNHTAQFLGTMTKQPAEEIEKQLKELRDAWE